MKILLYLPRTLRFPSTVQLGSEKFQKVRKTFIDSPKVGKGRKFVRVKIFSRTFIGFIGWCLLKGMQYHDDLLPRDTSKTLRVPSSNTCLYLFLSSTYKFISFTSGFVTQIMLVRRSQYTLLCLHWSKRGQTLSSKNLKTDVSLWKTFPVENERKREGFSILSQTTHHPWGIYKQLT